MLAFPTSENTLCLFVASLYQEGLAGSSAKSYLAAVRYSQIAMGLGDPKMSEWPRLSYIVRGFKKLTAASRRKESLPVTPSILRKLKTAWQAMEDTFNAHMLWAVVCTCFFGFLRSGEVVVPVAAAYDPSVHLSHGDVKVDSISAPSYVTVTLKASKTDVFRKGVTVYLGRTGQDLCPVAAILSYLAQFSGSKAKRSGPFFQFSDGRPLTRERLVKELRRGLELAGVKADNYAGHSFRIGAASTAAAQGLSDSLIKTLGRWESAAYTLYIRTPRRTLCSVAASLVQAKLTDK